MLKIKEMATFRARIQRYGKCPDGSPRFMIYATKMVNQLGFKPGEEVEFHCIKVGEANIKPRNPNPNLSNGFKKGHPLHKQKPEPEVKAEYKEDEAFLPEELEFITKYKENKDSENVRNILEKAALMQFGDLRGEFLINYAKDHI